MTDFTIEPDGFKGVILDVVGQLDTLADAGTKTVQAAEDLAGMARHESLVIALWEAIEDVVRPGVEKVDAAAAATVARGLSVHNEYTRADTDMAELVDEAEGSR